MVLSVQYLRGIAALMVLCEHVALKSTQYSTSSLSGWHVGGAGVDLFFLISGYIMCHTTENKHQQVGAAREFIWRRVLRIIPLYWLITLAALAIFIIAPEKINSGGGGTDILASFFLLPTEQLYLVANGWTLRFEFLFYFIFMLGLLFTKTTGRSFIIAVIIVLVALGQWLTPSNIVLRTVTNPFILEFAVGMALYYVYQYSQRHQPSSFVFGSILLGLGIGSLAAVNQGLQTDIRVIDFGIPMLLLMVGALYLESTLNKRPVQLLKILGDSSYAMYLSHPFVLAGGAMVMNTLHLNNWLGGIPFVVVLLVGSITIGYLIYILVEKPISRRLSSIQNPLVNTYPVSATQTTSS